MIIIIIKSEIKEIYYFIFLFFFDFSWLTWLYSNQVIMNYEICCNSEWILLLHLLPLRAKEIRSGTTAVVVRITTFKRQLPLQIRAVHSFFTELKLNGGRLFLQQHNLLDKLINPLLLNLDSSITLFRFLNFLQQCLILRLRFPFLLQQNSLFLLKLSLALHH